MLSEGVLVYHSEERIVYGNLMRIRRIFEYGKRYEKEEKEQFSPFRNKEEIELFVFKELSRLYPHYLIVGPIKR